MSRSGALDFAGQLSVKTERAGGSFGERLSVNGRRLMRTSAIAMAVESGLTLLDLDQQNRWGGER